MADKPKGKKFVQKEEKPKDSNAPSVDTKSNLRRNTSKVRSKRKGDDRRKRNNEDDGFDTKIINIRRVTRMFKGGRRMRLSVFVVIGDREGKVGVGIGKGPDVRAAQSKAVSNAKKNLVQVPLKGNTIPHDVVLKHGAARIIIKPAAPGTGIVAGSSMRAVAEVAGIKDMLGKIMGTNNQITNAYATVEALGNLRPSRN
ncbi:30S ribosomal protein S5 [Candidatus Dojkabacteria bacterium]|uniref:Small ribosomal subunit protein uS5 n=1 Tax=Candidatus Dojkabacteria bacterium TaxID=2099670 RepID=A0A955ICU4_9BACT|nr:30S ribosomal protein S5 [Candidatus Dojkabacteria bacterium]